MLIILSSLIKIPTLPVCHIGCFFPNSYNVANSISGLALLYSKKEIRLELVDPKQLFLTQSGARELVKKLCIIILKMPNLCHFF